MHTFYLLVLLLYGAVCAYCILYWARRTTPKGNWGLKPPSGFFWVLQLCGICIVYWKHLNLLHLVWWAPVSGLGYSIPA